MLAPFIAVLSFVHSSSFLFINSLFVGNEPKNGRDFVARQPVAGTKTGGRRLFFCKKMKAKNYFLAGCPGKKSGFEESRENPFFRSRGPYNLKKRFLRFFTLFLQIY